MAPPSQKGGGLEAVAVSTSQMPIIFYLFIIFKATNDFSTFFVKLAYTLGCASHFILHRV